MSNEKTTTSLDRKTLEILIKEANKKYNSAEKEFEDSDSVDAMHDSEHWAKTVGWLTEKLKIKK